MAFLLQIKDAIKSLTSPETLNSLAQSMGSGDAGAAIAPVVGPPATNVPCPTWACASPAAISSS